MPPSQYVEKPYKVNAEQYVAGTSREPRDATTQDGGALCRCTWPYLDGRLHLHGREHCWEVHDTDWVCQEQWTPHSWFVIPDAEFKDRF